MFFSEQLQENYSRLKQECTNCDDIIFREMRFGQKETMDGLLVYVEMAVSNLLIEESALGKLLGFLQGKGAAEMAALLSENSLGVSDLEECTTWEEMKAVLLAGNAVLFLEQVPKAFKIGTKGYPGQGVRKAESEKTLRGSKEAFGESVKMNTALIRKRLRTTQLKIEETVTGRRSETRTALIYMEDLVRQELLERVRNSFDSFVIDGVLDSGTVEQLTEKRSLSPFPQYQTTERPDLAAAAVLEGRIVVLCDNSPIALVLPATLNSFLQTGDDYYGKFGIATLLRLIRYGAVILAFSLPGFYLAITGFHPQLLPPALALSLAEARAGVPFSGFTEVIFLELAFELLREAGLRMPGAIGNTIGIVGGLIIGQAAVSANLISPVVVLVVAMTALGSFSIPNEELSEAFRLLKYGMIFLCGFFGMYGYLFGWLFLLIYLAGLDSFGIPYLVPFTDAPGQKVSVWRDGILRGPLGKLQNRPVYTRNGARRRLRRKKGGKEDVFRK